LPRQAGLDLGDDLRRGGAVQEVLTKSLDVAVGDQAGGEAEEGFMDVAA
jgi:hypothetical protein